ncbi:glucose-6-phosphatase, partial [Elysia marginata]
LFIMTTALMYWGISAITDIQEKFKDYSGFMVFLSYVGDPRFAFTIYFPVAYSLHRSVGVRVLLAAVISEWLNAVLKWLLHGERPYWWVHQAGLYPQGAVPYVRQFNITCETGPGSPSGHAMITSSVWYILVSDFLYYKQVQSVFIKVLCWALFLLLMCAVSLSRLFIAAHFPHQVFAGILTGVILGQALNSVSTSALKSSHYIAVSAGLSCLAWAIYTLIQAVGMDPMWSVTLAIKWCAYKEWIHLDTTLFYSLVRDVSSLTGLGVGVWLLSGKHVEKCSTPHHPASLVIQVVFALAVSLSAENYKPAHDNLLLFLSISFLKHCLTVIVILAGISLLFDKAQSQTLSKKNSPSTGSKS